MLSRHADAAYWIGRYIERAEATARMIDVHYHFGLESPLVGNALTWESILAISGQEELFAKHYPNQDEVSILKFFAFDQRNPNSICNSVKFARENGRSIRDQISSEMWESLNRFYLEYQTWDVKKITKTSPFEFFSWVKNRSHLFQGITNRTLMMGETRDFHDAGRFLERGDQTARILDVKYHDILPKYSGVSGAQDQAFGVGGPVDTHGWISVLKSVGAFEAFRKTHRQGVTPARVSEFLVLDSKFPASVRHCVGRVNDCLRRVSGNKDLSPHNEAERKVGQLYNELNYMRGEDLVMKGLHESLEKIQDDCADIGDAIKRTYLKY